MKKGPIIVDGALRKVQKVIAMAIVLVIRIINNIAAETKSTLIYTYLEPLTDSMRMLCASFSYLLQARKDVILI